MDNTNINEQVIRKYTDNIKKYNIKAREAAIFDSELLFFINKCVEHNVNLIIESGTSCGYSTEVICRYFSDINVISIEKFPQSRDCYKYYVEANESYYSKFNVSRSDKFLEDNMVMTYPDFCERVKEDKLDNVHLLQGDSNVIIPDLLKQYPNLSVAILIDGPKEIEGLKLCDTLLENHESIKFICVHDVGSMWQCYGDFKKYKKNEFITSDSNEYQSKYRYLDNDNNAPHYLSVYPRGCGLSYCVPERQSAPSKWQPSQDLIRSGALSNDQTVPEDYDPKYSREDLVACDLNQLANIFGSDKGSIKHNYTRVYERVLREIAPDRVNVRMEIAEFGVACGASLKMWSTYFPNSTITGYDIRPECAKLCENYPNVGIKICDPRAVNDIAGFYDVVIDDASHIAEDIATNFYHCYNWVKPGGLYIIEDLNCTYSGDYGKSYATMFNKPETLNSRMSILGMMDVMMRQCDSERGIASIEIHPRFIIIKKY